MKCGARVALGVAGGYFLGRTKKMKLALMIGGMAAGSKVTDPGALLSQGAKLAGSSPELSALRDQVRGRLVDAGKDVVSSVVTRQIEALTGRLTERVENIGGGAASAASGASDTATSVASGAPNTVSRPRRNARRAEDAESVEVDEHDDAPVAEDHDVDGEAPTERRFNSRNSRPSGDGKAAAKRTSGSGSSRAASRSSSGSTRSAASSGSSATKKASMATRAGSTARKAAGETASRTRRPTPRSSS